MNMFDFFNHILHWGTRPVVIKLVRSRRSDVNFEGSNPPTAD